MCIYKCVPTRPFDTSAAWFHSKVEKYRRMFIEHIAVATCVSGSVIDMPTDIYAGLGPYVTSSDIGSPDGRWYLFETGSADLSECLHRCRKFKHLRIAR